MAEEFAPQKWADTATPAPPPEISLPARSLLDVGMNPIRLRDLIYRSQRKAALFNSGLQTVRCAHVKLPCFVQNLPEKKINPHRAGRIRDEEGTEPHAQNSLLFWFFN